MHRKYTLTRMMSLVINNNDGVLSSFYSSHSERERQKEEQRTHTRELLPFTYFYFMFVVYSADIDIKTAMK